MVEIRLPYVPASSSVRTDTGIIATSGSSGSSSRSSSQPRTAVAHSATTTSLTVIPSSFLSRLTVSSESEPNAKRRCGPTRPLKLVFGGRAVVTSSTDRVVAAGAREHARQPRHDREGVGAGEVGQVRQRRRQRAQRAQRLARHAEQPAAEHLEVAGDALARLARRLRRQLLALGARVEQHAEDLVARHAVDHRVVQLGQHRHAAALEPLDQVQLPQRPRAVQRAREDPRDGLGQPAVVARRRHRALADVEVEVEGRVLDPVRQVDPERHLDQPPAERRQHVQPLGHHAADVADLERAARRGRRVVDGEAADVPVRARGLHPQELRVEARQLAHTSVLPDRSTVRTCSTSRSSRWSRVRRSASRRPACASTTCRRSRARTGP